LAQGFGSKPCTIIPTCFMLPSNKIQVSNWFLGAVRTHENKLDVLAEILSDIALRMDDLETKIAVYYAAKPTLLTDIAIRLDDLETKIADQYATKPTPICLHDSLWPDSPALDSKQPCVASALVPEKPWFEVDFGSFDFTIGELDLDTHQRADHSLDEPFDLCGRCWEILPCCSCGVFAEPDDKPVVPLGWGTMQKFDWKDAIISHIGLLASDENFGSGSGSGSCDLSVADANAGEKDGGDLSEFMKDLGDKGSGDLHDLDDCCLSIAEAEEWTKNYLHAQGVKVASRAVGSALLMLVALIYVFGIILFIILKTEEEALVAHCFRKLGVTMWTLLIDGVFLDGIGLLSRALMDSNQYFSTFLLLLFVLLSALTVMNMLIGVLCEVVSQVASAEKEDIAIRMVKDNLLELLRELDEDGSGELSRNEVLEALKFPDVIETFESLRVDVHYLMEHLDMFFEHGDLPIHRVLDMILMLRGDRAPTMKDLLHKDTFNRWKIIKSFKTILDTVERDSFRARASVKSGCN